MFSPSFSSVTQNIAFLLASRTIVMLRITTNQGMCPFTPLPQQPLTTTLYVHVCASVCAWVRPCMCVCLCVYVCTLLSFFHMRVWLFVYRCLTCVCLQLCAHRACNTSLMSRLWMMSWILDQLCTDWTALTGSKNTFVHFQMVKTEIEISIHFKDR